MLLRLFNAFMDGQMSMIKPKNLCKTKAEWRGLGRGSMSICR